MYDRSPYHHLLDDKQVELWVSNLERGSHVLANDYFRRLGRVCKDFETTPTRLAEISQKEAYQFLLTVIAKYQQAGMFGSTQENYVKALKSWWKFNGIDVTNRVRLNKDKSRYENEIPPTSAELQKILDHCDVRAKVAVSLMAFCGFRNEVLGDSQADDGLKVADVQDLVIEDGNAKFAKTPALLRVRKSLSKAGHQYFTFLSQQGCDYMKEYLESRIRGGEKITAASPIITATKSNPKFVGGHITTANVGDMIRKAMREAGYSSRPYVLRRYFSHGMMMAESEGLITHDWWQFWLGHKGNMESTYTVNKGLADKTIESMREKYAKAADKHLATMKKEDSRKETMEAINKQFLVWGGFNEEEIQKLGDISELSPQQIQELMKQRLMQKLGLNGNRQKVVTMSEVKPLVENGWEFVSSLPSGEAIMGLPTRGV